MSVQCKSVSEKNRDEIIFVTVMKLAHRGSFVKWICAAVAGGKLRKSNICANICP